MAFTQVDEVTLTVAHVTEEGEPEPTPPPDGLDIGALMGMMVVVMMMGVMMQTMEGAV